MKQTLISLKDYLSNLIYLINELGQFHAYLYCSTRKIRNEIVLVNIKDIPDSMDINCLLNIINGKSLKL